MSYHDFDPTGRHPEKGRNSIKKLKVKHPEKERMSNSEKAVIIVTVGVVGLIGANQIFFSKAHSQEPQAMNDVEFLPTPRAGDASVFQIVNCDSTPLDVTRVFTTTANFSTTQTYTLAPREARNVHVRDELDIPKPVTGAITLYADKVITATLVGYDNDTPIDPDIPARIKKVDFDKDGRVSAVDGQKVTGRYGQKVCDQDYLQQYDTRSTDGSFYSEGEIGAIDGQEVLSVYGETYTTTLTLNNAQAPVQLSPIQVRLDPQIINLASANETFTVTVKAKNVQNLGSAEFGLKIGPDLKVENVEFSNGARKMSVIKKQENDGTTSYAAVSEGMSPNGASGEEVEVAKLAFTVNNATKASGTITRADLGDVKGRRLFDAQIEDQVFTVFVLPHRNYVPLVEK
ncbi:hypothetical protein C4559_04170 [Candidatus Microgenomates bacterium]|nr:MAG: hypothetical protein C4559_04170 [Candidatus Microgenomates bacterium]